jgi:hypothetical protein
MLIAVVSLLKSICATTDIAAVVAAGNVSRLAAGQVFAKLAEMAILASVNAGIVAVKVLCGKVREKVGPVAVAGEKVKSVVTCDAKVKVVGTVCVAVGVTDHIGIRTFMLSSSAPFPLPWSLIVIRIGKYAEVIPVKVTGVGEFDRVTLCKVTLLAFRNIIFGNLCSWGIA